MYSGSRGVVAAMVAAGGAAGMVPHTAVAADADAAAADADAAAAAADADAAAADADAAAADADAAAAAADAKKTTRPTWGELLLMLLLLLLLGQIVHDCLTPIGVHIDTFRRL